VLKKIAAAAKDRYLDCSQTELTRHTGITVDGLSTTVPRHSEIPDHIAKTIFRQLEPKLGKGWWK
jgi:hypothetical protein